VPIRRAFMAPFFLEGTQLEIGSTRVIGKGSKRALVEVRDKTTLSLRLTNGHPVYAGEATTDGLDFAGHVHTIRHDTELTRQSVSTLAKKPQIIWKER